MKQNKQKSKIAIIIIILAVSIILLAFLDAVVMENVYKQIYTEHSLPWKEFEVIFNIFNSKIILTQWNFAFLVLGIVLFLLLGLAAMDWRLSISGIILFATGWEDIAYYSIILEKIPKTLEWLDPNPLVSWTRIITQSSHVTSTGLFISAFVGLLAVILIFNYKRIFKKK